MKLLFQIIGIIACVIFTSTRSDYKNPYYGEVMLERFGGCLGIIIFMLWICGDAIHH